MKRLFSIFCLILSVFLLSSCELNINIKDDDSNQNPTVTTEQAKEILAEYKDKTYFTIAESVFGMVKEDIAFDMSPYITADTLSYHKYSDIDYENRYMYSEINNAKCKKKLYVDGNKIYEETIEKTKPLYEYSEINNAYDFIGISALFELDDFIIKENKAVFTISGTDVLKFGRAFRNILIESNAEFSYNPSVLIAEVYFKDNDIDYISLDLSMVFGSYFKYLRKSISIILDEFEKKNLKADIENKDFLVETSNVLDTYVLEMVYEFGDSIYIKSGDFDMLIDAGQYPDGENVKKMLDEHCTDDTLDVLIATHGHADHTGGFSNGALDTIEKVNLIIDYGYKDDNSYAYEKLRDDYISKGAFYASAYDCINLLGKASKIYRFSDDLTLEVLNTDQYLKTGSYMPSDGNENDYSVVCKLTFKGHTYLYTGDLSGDKFTDALKKEEISKVTVYKAAHHGATTYNSNNQTFLNYLNPQICVSSAAIINQDKPTDHSAYEEIVYQHPRPLFVRWILNSPSIKETKAYYFNGTMGTIHLSDDGTKYPQVTGLGATRGYNDASGNKITNEENKKFYDTYMYQNYYK